jgi:hypothetical protein
VPGEDVSGGVADQDTLGVPGVQQPDCLADPVGAGFHPLGVVIVAGDEHDGNGLLFTSPGGSPLRHTNFRIRVWLPALRAAGLPTIHFHDLRHTGNMFAADAGAGLRELMDRMGHSTTRAALTYLHGSDERQRAIAEALVSPGICHRWLPTWLPTISLAWLMFERSNVVLNPRQA